MKWWPKLHLFDCDVFLVFSPPFGHFYNLPLWHYIVSDRIWWNQLETNFGCLKNKSESATKRQQEKNILGTIIGEGRYDSRIRPSGVGNKTALGDNAVGESLDMPVYDRRGIALSSFFLFIQNCLFSNNRLFGVSLSNAIACCLHQMPWILLLLFV